MFWRWCLGPRLDNGKVFEMSPPCPHWVSLMREEVEVGSSGLDLGGHRCHLRWERQGINLFRHSGVWDNGMPNTTANVELEFGSPQDWEKGVEVIIEDLKVDMIARLQVLSWSDQFSVKGSPLKHQLKKNSSPGLCGSVGQSVIPCTEGLLV